MAILLIPLDIKDFLRLIRWPNLVLVTVCLLAFHRVLATHLPTSSPGLNLSGIDFILFILVALIITAGGYVINDLQDIHADSINRPDRILVKQADALPFIWNLYYTLVAAGFLLSTLIAWRVSQWIWLPLYPLVTVSLFLYASRWKGAPLWGNLLVSLLTSLLPLTLVLPELDVLRQLPPGPIEAIQTAFGGFAILSLSTSFYREWIKDMEDVQGDQAAGWTTWVVVHGLGKARSRAIYLGICSILPLLAGVLVFSGYPWSQLVLGTAACLQIRMLIYLFQSDYASHLRAISQSAKWTLALGLVAVLSL